MDYATDFKAICPLLRKEKWTWKTATGIQIQYWSNSNLHTAHFTDSERASCLVFSHNYIKPGCKLKGGEQREDFFNGEDELLATFILQGTTDAAPMSLSNLRPVKRPKKSSKSTPSQKKVTAKGTKKTTKKQVSEEANQRRRELAAFNKVWGNRNSTGGFNADMAMRLPVNPDLDCPTTGAYGDKDAPPQAAAIRLRPTKQMQIPQMYQVLKRFTAMGVLKMLHKILKTRYVRRGSGEIPTLGLHDHSEFAALRFSYSDVLDPNFTGSSSRNLLDTDGEGYGDFAEVVADESDDAPSETSESCKSDCLPRELRHVAELLTKKELERLHLNSSEVYTDDQHDDMKRSGWEVLPVNTVAEVTNDAAVDKIYDGYCGPSKAIMTALRSPLKLFYYFLPKPFWRKVAAQTNL
ncbi:unnamed protein product [Phytophthora fragariaefolia]|uniref:Unnamed protein product n=1 Tax=Phytophthora fragariaefolia TaxID=1490495 RepID=A0A9W6UAU8_9STRA|nr:unnamed protein product [Phytophthora fragariaefolia]